MRSNGPIEMGGLLFAHGSTWHPKEPSDDDSARWGVVRARRTTGPARQPEQRQACWAHVPVSPHRICTCFLLECRRCLSRCARMHSTSCLFFFLQQGVVPCHANWQWTTTRAGGSTRVTLSGMIWDATSRDPEAG